MARKKSLAKRWSELPSSIKVLPYLFVAGGLAEIVKYLSALEVNSIVLMGTLNLIVVVLKDAVKYFKERSK